ncbi:unnamed protein product [Lota lota]
MSDSGSGNSWTLLSQEENVATLRPLAEGTEPHGDSKSQLTEVATPAKTEHLVENQQASEENMSGQFDGEASPSITQNPRPTTTPTRDPSPTTTPTSDPSPTLIPTIETPPPPPSLVIPAHSLHGSDAHSQSEGLPEGPVESSPEPDSFSDSYTHISSSSPDEPPVPELLGGLELTEEDEEADRPGSEGEGSEQGLGPSQSGSSVDPQVGEDREQEDGEAKGDAEVRRRSLLASLEEIGRREQEEPEEEFQLPRRNDDSGFSVNKCILGAVILLGLGTIFFSENDYASRDMRDTEQPVKQEWQKPEAPQAAVDEGMEILNKLVKETQQIVELHAKTQAQKEELNAANGQAAEGAQEQLRRSKKEEKKKKEVEEENVNEAPLLHPVIATTAPLAGLEGESRPATAGTEGQAKKPWHGGGEGEKTDSRERVKTERKDDERKKPNHDQQERSKEVKGWKQKEEKREGKEQGHRGDKGEPWRDRGDGKEWRGKEERNDQKEEKKWKKGKHDKFDSDRDEEQRGYEKEKKKVKDRGDRKEWTGKDEERNEWKEWKRGKEEKEGKKGKDERRNEEEREWKKGKSDKLDKERRGQEEKSDGTGRKEHGKRKQEKEEWKGETEWKKAKDAYKESGKEWKEKKEWREKGEPKDWQKDTDRRGKNDKDHRREQQGKEERKPWEGKEERKHWEKKEERNPWEGKEERKRWEKKDRPYEGKAKREAWKEERKDVNWKQDRKRNSGREEDVDHKKQEQHRHDHHRKEPLWQGHGDGKPTHTHRRPSFGQPDYWVRQRERLRQNALPSRHCDSVENCARAEGTLPVQLSEFEALLEGYLTKAEEGAGVDASAKEEVRTLAAEFFKDGVFVHEQMSFRDYLEDLADILEDMVDGDDSEEEEDKEEDDSDLEDEMEMFGKEVMKRFAVERSSEKTERKTGKSKKENERGRG